MKLRTFYLSLLTVVAISHAEGMQRKLQDAPVEVQKYKQVETQMAPHLDSAGHGHQHAAAMQDIVDNVGVHPTAPTGTTVNHTVADLNTRLGTKAAAPTGPSAHEKLTDLLAIQGAVTNRATARG